MEVRAQRFWPQQLTNSINSMLLRYDNDTTFPISTSLAGARYEPKPNEHSKMRWFRKWKWPKKNVQIDWKKFLLVPKLNTIFLSPLICTQYTFTISNLYRMWQNEKSRICLMLMLTTQWKNLLQKVWMDWPSFRYT